MSEIPGGAEALPVPSLALIVLDGWGLAPPGPGNAIELASTPVFDELWDRYPRTTLSASGRAVGLPDGQMGNSEVGHLNLGAGSVVKQDLARIDDAIADGSFFENPVLKAACEAARQSPRGRLHLMGLVSDGAHRGVHRARGAGGCSRSRRPCVHRRPRHPAEVRAGLHRRARALAAPGGPDRHRGWPLLRHGSRSALGAHEARL
jgi:Metalloenzyme superfamily/BPG-independent PGAM N-terminus (iPGM_N)